MEHLHLHNLFRFDFQSKEFSTAVLFDFIEASLYTLLKEEEEKTHTHEQFTKYINNDGENEIKNLLNIFVPHNHNA